jgi:hypothetical protein
MTISLVMRPPSAISLLQDEDARDSGFAPAAAARFPDSRPYLPSGAPLGGPTCSCPLALPRLGSGSGMANVVLEKGSRELAERPVLRLRLGSSRLQEGGLLQEVDDEARPGCAD